MKKIRLILPALAFVFAIVASHATVNAKSALVQKRVSYPSTSNCQDIGSCTTTTDNHICTDDGGLIVKEYISVSSCANSFNGYWDD